VPLDSIATTSRQCLASSASATVTAPIFPGERTRQGRPNEQSIRGKSPVR